MVYYLLFKKKGTLKNTSFSKNFKYYRVFYVNNVCSKSKFFIKSVLSVKVLNNLFSYNYKNIFFFLTLKVFLKIFLKFLFWIKSYPFFNFFFYDSYNLKLQYPSKINYFNGTIKLNFNKILIYLGFNRLVLLTKYCKQSLPKVKNYYYISIPSIIYFPTIVFLYNFL